MISKHVLDARRLRRVPPSFGWVDHRLVRAGHIRRCGPEAWALYLFLVTVADAEGLSYYSDAKAASLLGMGAGTLAQARGELVRARLVAWNGELYQVLNLEQDAASPSPGMGSSERLCAGGARTVGSILAQMIQEASHVPHV